MKRSVGIGLSTAIIAPVILTAAVSWGAASDTGCWDEYNNRGTRMYRTITPKDLDLADCTPASSCKWGYAARDGRRNRLYVPHGQDPATACDDIAATTTQPTVVTTLPPSTTEPAPGTTVPAPGGRFGLLPVGAELPSEATCASQVRSMSENRPENAAANATAGTRSDALYPRVTGNFTGTTDEIIQWAACKWGIDEDWARAQVVNESNWNQDALGDFTSDAAHCHPGNPIGDYPAQYNGDHEHVNECPESFGLGQVRYQFHDTAFADDNAIESSAYNLDYTYAVWRTCFEGGYPWLNDPGLPGRGDYAAGDAEGCLGVWFSGRWYTSDAVGYIDRFHDTLSNRTWEQSWFPAAQADSGTSTTLPPIVTIPPATTAPATTAPATTVPAPTTTHAPAPTTTAAPPTTAPAPPTTVPPNPAPGGGFFEDFAGNSGLERFKTGVFHRDDFLVSTTSWTGDHDESCGSPDSQRTITRDRPNDTFYMCRDHLMTAVGDTSGYSIAWFSPNQTFRADDVTQVSWDVNMTDLGNRQWWEVSIVALDEPFLASVDWVASTANIDAYGSKSVVVGKGPFGNDGNIMTNGVSHDPLGWGQVCGYDPEACASKAIRRTFTVTDNRNGTLTFDFLGQRYTYAGSFPDEFRVYFKDHNYTPDKDGVPVGHSWHWDNIRVG